MSENIILRNDLLAVDPFLRPISVHEIEIFHHLNGSHKLFRFYKDPKVTKKVYEVVPIAELTTKCSKRMLEMQSAKQLNGTNSTSDQDFESREVFFLLLLEWFKENFFKWFDVGYCESCQRKMSLLNHGTPSVEEIKWDASRVEIYKCQTCGSIERFPRYNHPFKLMETRRGRCGEWRNCFAAICVNFNYDMRLVHDFQDHVWNEVYFESQKRWIHCDCCENAFDTPFMYEVGWGKKYTFVLSVSEWEYQDVTCRYIRDASSLINKRKNLCRPGWLEKMLLYFSNQLQKSCSAEMKTKLLARRIAELAELIQIPGNEKQLKDSETRGRTSGSIDWRIARGETVVKQNAASKSGYVVKFDSNQSSQNTHRFTYSSVFDQYSIDDKTVKGWFSMVFYQDNIFKKLERDWNMTYLARQENCDCSKNGVLIYRFDVNFDWNSVTINVATKVYETGNIVLRLTSLPIAFNKLLIPNEVNHINKSDLPNNIEYLNLTITLSGGAGNIGWQQAQLFRHSIVDKKTDNSLEVIFNK